jgi:NAD-dependent deacetylase
MRIAMMYQELTKIIKDSSRLVFFGGAGVSTESGLADFRSGSGLYARQRAFGVSGEDMLSRSFFEHEPERFFAFYKAELVHPDVQPNEAHYALARLERLGLLKTVITQNIDGLHQKAGSREVCELHGSIYRNYCVHCGTAYDLDYVMDSGNCEGSVPRGRSCEQIVRPDIVLYEEELQKEVLAEAEQAVEAADTLLVGGTSLAVQPAAGLLDHFHGRCLVLINRDRTPYDERADLVIHDRIGRVLAAATEWI